MIKKLTILISLMLFTSVLAFSQDNTAYRETLKQMMEVNGSAATYNALISQIVTTFKAQKPEVKEEVWDEFGKAFTKSASEDLFDILLPIYQKHLSLDDLKNIIVFYQSPTGKKLAEKTPLIAQESMQAGQAWGKKIGEEFVKKLAEKGY